MEDMTRAEIASKQSRLSPYMELPVWGIAERILPISCEIFHHS